MVDMLELVECIDTCMPDKKKRQTLMFSNKFPEQRRVAAMYNLKKDYVSLTIDNVCDEQHTKMSEHVDIHEPVDELQSEWSDSDDWGHPVSSPKLNLEQAVTNLTSKLEELSTSVKKIQERNKEIQEEVKETQKRNGQLQQEVKILQRKNASLEKKLSSETQVRPSANSTPCFGNIKEEDIYQLLTCCESFQKNLDNVNDQQQELEDRQHKVEDMLRCLSCSK